MFNWIHIFLVRTPTQRAKSDATESRRELYAARLRLEEAQASIDLHTARIARLGEQYAD